MDKMALAEEVLVRLQRGENPGQFAEDLIVFLRDSGRWRKTESGLVVPAEDRRAWTQGVYGDLGITCVVPPVPALTSKQVKSLERFTFRLFFIPAIAEEAYPASFVKPDWGRHLDASQIERRPLPGKWVAVETIAKPDWNDPAGYCDDLLAAALKLKSRFGISWDDLHDGGLLGRIARVTGFPRKTTRQPTAEEWNFLANLFNWLRANRRENLPDLGSTASWEWCENTCESDSRLAVGSREDGGLAGVHRGWHGDRGDSLAFRALAVL